MYFCILKYIDKVFTAYLCTNELATSHNLQILNNILYTQKEQYKQVYFVSISPIFSWWVTYNEWVMATALKTTSLYVKTRHTACMYYNTVQISWKLNSTHRTRTCHAYDTHNTQGKNADIQGFLYAWQCVYQWCIYPVNNKIWV